MSGEVCADPGIASSPAQELIQTGVEEAVGELSAPERDILRLVADGHTNKEIGEKVDLSALTVKSHLARIARKLGTGDRAHMVLWASVRGSSTERRADSRRPAGRVHPTRCPHRGTRVAGPCRRAR